jgi:hypothetical protein
MYKLAFVFFDNPRRRKQPTGKRTKDSFIYMNCAPSAVHV